MFGLIDHSSVHGRTSQLGCTHLAISGGKHCGNQDMNSHATHKYIQWCSHVREHMMECSHSMDGLLNVGLQRGVQVQSVVCI